MKDLNILLLLAVHAFACASQVSAAEGKRIPSPSGACDVLLPADWEIDHSSTNEAPIVFTFAPIAPSKISKDANEEAIPPLIQVHEMPGPVPSSSMLRSQRQDAGPAQAALLVLQRLFQERGFKTSETKREVREQNGMVACDVAVKGPPPRNTWTARMILLSSDKTDSYYGVTMFSHQSRLSESEKAFESVANTLRPVKPVPKPKAGKLDEKIGYLTEILKRGNATENPPWRMAVLALALFGPNDRDSQDTLLVHLRFLHPQAERICTDYVQVIADMKAGKNVNSTHERSKMAELFSAHAGALSLEVVRKDLAVDKTVLVIYGDNNQRIAAYQTSLDIYRRVLQGKGGGGKELFLSWKPIGGADLARLPLPPTSSVLNEK